MTHLVHLVGSLPCSSADATFRLLATQLGSRARRYTDGETGDRSRWIAWQGKFFAGVPGLEPGLRIERAPGDFLQQYRVAVKDERELEFPNLGYADAALESYATFRQLKSEGVIPEGTRFQVCLPTPLAVVWAFVEQQSIAKGWPAYERAMKREVERIVAGIPSQNLAIQWDIAVEPVFILGRPEVLKFFPEDALVASIARASRPIPAAAELGIHLCFGDTTQKHAIVADDLGELVSFANLLIQGLDHQLSWIHVPAPQKADYGRYFSPLRQLKRQPGTEVHVGLINEKDGVDGARTRLLEASKHLPALGVSTECGLGRRPMDQLASIFETHRALAATP